jgi:hypothetical protein
MYDAKPVSIAIAQRSKQRARHLLSAKQAHPSSQRDMHWVRLVMNRSRTVRRLPQMQRARLATRTTPRAAAPLGLWKRERELIGTHPHLTRIY